jgi:hypothetical protein
VIDFSRLLICPGAQKSGTTWLHHVLCRHPAFWIPPTKELDYLFPSPQSRKNQAERMPPRAAATRPNSFLRAWVDLLLQEWDLQRYPRLFDASAGRFTADISPNYSKMSNQEVRDAFAVAASARIAIFLRDPVERAWSHARMAAEKWKIVDPIQHMDRMIQFVHSRGCNSRADYPRLINDWSFHFGKENVVISFYEDLEADPQKFIDRILSFLGAPEFPRDRLEVLGTRTNVGAAIAMPDDVRRALETRHNPMIAKLRELIGTEAAPAWLHRG